MEPSLLSVDPLIALESHRRLGQTFRQDKILLPPPSPARLPREAPSSKS